MLHDQQYIRRHQCDSYESLLLIKHSCYNVQLMFYIVLENDMLHKFKVSKMNRCTCMHLQRKRQIDVFDLLIKVRLFLLNLHRLQIIINHNHQSATNIERIFCFWVVFVKETKTVEFSGSQKRKEKERENGKNTSSLTHVAKLILYQY